jgi:hypothetical protein
MTAESSKLPLAPSIICKTTKHNVIVVPQVILWFV